MITREGTLHIKRYMAGWTPSIALSMAFGVGTTPVTADDQALQFEVGRSDIELVNYDFVEDKLVFKATLDEGFDATIHEVALYSLESNIQSGEYGSRLLASFDSETENWMQASNPATYTTQNTRIGADSILVSAAANGTVTVTSSDLALDLSGYSSADELSFAFYVNNTNLSSLRFRFRTDAENYYEFTVPGSSTGAGFNVKRAAKGTASVTGNPNWGLITSLDVVTTAKSEGAVAVNLEGIRVEDMDTVAPDYVMVARTVLAVPFDKVAGRIQEVEFPIGVTVNGG